MKLLIKQLSALILATLLSTSCSVIQDYHHQNQNDQIEGTLASSKLDRISEFNSRTPFHKTYEFEFNSSNNPSYALIFYISDSNFSKSVIKHRYQTDLRRDSVRIDNDKDILSTLYKNIPDVESIAWQQVANQIPNQEARDSYLVLQAYIRQKIRDL